MIKCGMCLFERGWESIYLGSHTLSNRLENGKNSLSSDFFVFSEGIVQSVGTSIRAHSPFRCFPRPKKRLSAKSSSSKNP